MTLLDFYQTQCVKLPYDLSHNPHGFRNNDGSDISAHLPLLKFIAQFCNHITEFGTRECCSTSAFLAGCKGQVVSYDINTNSTIEHLQETTDKQWTFIQQDTTDVNFQIDPTDFLFIDSLHTYDQVVAELQQATFVNKYIGFHDTFSQGANSLDVPGALGIAPAINDFLNTHPEWSIAYEVLFNHGLVIIEKNME